MYRVVKELQRKEPKKKILVDSEHGITTNEKIQTEIVKKFFQDQFHNEKEEMIKEVKPMRMQTAFTSTEITTNEKIQTEIVKKFFQDQFHNEKEEMVKEVKPMKMQRAFTSTEIEKAVKRLKARKVQE